ERERLLDAAAAGGVDGRDRADRLHGLLADVLDRRAGAAGYGSDALREPDRVGGRLDEDDVRPGIVRDALQIGEVRDHERVTGGRGELLDDARHVERRDPEGTRSQSED